MKTIRSIRNQMTRISGWKSTLRLNTSKSTSKEEAVLHSMLVFTVKVCLLNWHNNLIWTLLVVKTDWSTKTSYVVSLNLSQIRNVSQRWLTIKEYLFMSIEIPQGFECNCASWCKLARLRIECSMGHLKVSGKDAFQDVLAAMWSSHV